MSKAVLTEFVLNVGINYRGVLCGRSQILFAWFQVLEAVVETYPETVLDALCDEFGESCVRVTL